MRLVTNKEANNYFPPMVNIQLFNLIRTVSFSIPTVKKNYHNIIRSQSSSSVVGYQLMFGSEQRVDNSNCTVISSISKSADCCHSQ